MPLSKPDAKSNDDLERLAAWIAKHHAQVPAVILIELAKPFGFLLSQILAALGPLTGMSDKTVDSCTHLLQDRTKLAQLQEIVETEQLAHRQD